MTENSDNIEPMFVYCPVCKFALREHTDEQLDQCKMEFARW